MPAQPSIPAPTYDNATKIIPTAVYQYLYTLVSNADVAKGQQAPGQGAHRITFFAGKGNASTIWLTKDIAKVAEETLLAEETKEDTSMAGWYVKTDAAGAANGDFLVVRRDFSSRA